MPDDILDAAQKQINDAAQLLTPPPSAVPLPPPSPLPSAPLIPAEKPLEVPPPPTPTPPVTPSDAPTPTESALVDTIIHESESAKTPPPATPPEPPAPPVTPFTPAKPEPSKKKGSGKGFVTAILFLLLLTVPIAVYYISQTKQLADIRNRAALVCGGYPPITCPNGSEACSLAQCPAPSGGATTGSGTGAAACWGIGGGQAERDCLAQAASGTYTSGACRGLTVQQCAALGRAVYCSGSQEAAGTTRAGEFLSCGGSSTSGCGQVDVFDANNTLIGFVIDKSGCGGQTTTTTTQNAPPREITTTTTDPTPTPTPTPITLQCLRIKMYKNNAPVDPTTLLPGDAVVLAVAGQNATKGRIRVNGSVWTESTTLNSSSEYTAPFTVPTDTTSFTVEAEVFRDGAWQ